VYSFQPIVVVVTNTTRTVETASPVGRDSTDHGIWRTCVCLAQKAEQLLSLEESMKTNVQSVC